MRNTKPQMPAHELAQSCKHDRLRAALMGHQAPRTQVYQSAAALEQSSVSKETRFYIVFIGLAMLTLLCHSVISIATM
jgi:hypothetical protein